MLNEKTVRFLKAMENIKKIGFKNYNGLKHREFVILYLIKEYIKKTNEEEKIIPNGISITTLSNKLDITKPAVSQMINVLEDKGYVKRITTKRDRRAVYVTLTEYGDEILNKCMQSFIKRTDKVLELLGEEDSNNFIRILEKVYNIVNEL